MVIFSNVDYGNSGNNFESRVFNSSNEDLNKLFKERTYNSLDLISARKPEVQKQVIDGLLADLHARREELSPLKID